MNPLCIAYADDAHLRAEQYAGTTGAFVLGRRNCIDPAWLRVRDRGSEIYQYRGVLERPNSLISAVDEELYLGGSANAALWPYLDAAGNPRSQYPTTKLIDIRVGSPVVAYMADCIARTIRQKRYTGMFLDGFGSQLFGAADWANWPAIERAEWTAGAVDAARLFDQARRAEDPNFILVGNNHWDGATVAEKYVDGIVSENHLVGPFWQRIVGKPSYSPLGQRRVFVISRTKADAIAWGVVPGVTHVCCTEDNTAAGDSQYSYPTKPVVGYSAIQKPSVDVTALQLQLTTTQSQLAGVYSELVEAQSDLSFAQSQCTALTTSLAEAGAALATAQSQCAALSSTSAGFAERLSQIHQLSGE